MRLTMLCICFVVLPGFDQLAAKDKKIAELEALVDILSEPRDVLPPKIDRVERLQVKIQRINHNVEENDLREIAIGVSKYSKEFKVSEDLMISLMGRESHFNKNAISKAGAVGLGQIMPFTSEEIAKELGVEDYNLTSIDDSIKFSAYYLSKMIKRFKGNKHLAIRAYNAGPNKVRKVLRGKEKYNRETVEYHKRIIEYLALVKS